MLTRKLALVALLGAPVTVISLMLQIAHAHAIVVPAQSAVNSTVAPGELQIRLDVNSRVERVFRMGACARSSGAGWSFGSIAARLQ
jgi:methionine-rich copper-binding protein CopC